MWPHRRQPTRLLCRPWDSPGKNTGVGHHFLLQCMKVKSESEVTQSCPTLRDPMDCSLPGSSVHGIFWGLSSHLAYSFFCCAKSFKFNQVPLVYFCFYFRYSRRWVIEDLALIYVIECSAYVSSKSFIVFGLIFRSLIYFEFIFVYGVWCSNFIILHVAV